MKTITRFGDLLWHRNFFRRGVGEKCRIVNARSLFAIDFLGRGSRTEFVWSAASTTAKLAVPSLHQDYSPYPSKLGPPVYSTAPGFSQESKAWDSINARSN